MAREDDGQAPYARKRARRQSPAARPVHPASLGAGLTSNDLQGPLNLLRVNGHREPGRYAVVPKETQALFHRDPETDTLVWFPAPPLDGPTQAASQRNTLVRTPLPSLDYLYQRITEQQSRERLGTELESNAVTGLDALAAAGDAILAAAAEAAAGTSGPTGKSSRSSSKRSKASKKRKAPVAQSAAVIEVDADARSATGPPQEATVLVEDTLTQEEAEARLLAGLDALSKSRLVDTAPELRDPIVRFLSGPSV